MRFRNGQPDIESRADCERLVRAFYERALEDPIIGFIFVEVAKLDLEAHVPRITSFWETILLGARSYSGGAFRPHAALHAKVRLREGHFAQWLNLWCRTVDELFAGERAELANAHAHRVADAFLGRLQRLPADGYPAQVTTGLTVTEHGPRARYALADSPTPATVAAKGDTIDEDRSPAHTGDTATPKASGTPRETVSRRAATRWSPKRAAPPVPMHVLDLRPGRRARPGS